MQHQGKEHVGRGRGRGGGSRSGAGGRGGWVGGGGGSEGRRLRCHHANKPESGKCQNPDRTQDRGDAKEALSAR